MTVHLIESVRARGGNFDKRHRKGYVFPTIAFGLEPGTACAQFQQLGIRDSQFRAQKPIVQTHQKLAGLHVVAIAGQNLAHDAAFGVLDHLPVAFDDDGALGDDGARDLGAQAPDADATDQQGKGDKADGEGECRAPGGAGLVGHCAMLREMAC